MEPNSAAASGSRDAESDAPADSTAAGPAAQSPHPRTAAERIGLLFLAAVVLGFGAVVFVFGPLMAIACSSCQDGVRSPIRFETALMATDLVGVPMTTLCTLVTIFTVQRAARAAGIGLGILLLLLLVQLGLGQAAA
ncbi:hypothetical protein [Streptomyces qinglanensis]|uniref:Uncharacterized protein n=1 Tax=Streptomyces qinglanensis TaxID=943816 RepID=A0A1H9WJQ9_9ACTN|nr:hypothetical protein [Streptomyces qinglanensis]SES34115.1 hypothetical protein SAMN05421870_11875 [Streptomyces qinglanensis]